MKPTQNLRDFSCWLASIYIYKHFEQNTVCNGQTFILDRSMSISGLVTSMWAMTQSGGYQQTVMVPRQSQQTQLQPADFQVSRHLIKEKLMIMWPEYVTVTSVWLVIFMRTFVANVHTYRRKPFTILADCALYQIVTLISFCATLVVCVLNRYVWRVRMRSRGRSSSTSAATTRWRSCGTTARTVCAPRPRTSR